MPKRTYAEQVRLIAVFEMQLGMNTHLHAKVHMKAMDYVLYRPPVDGNDKAADDLH